METKFILQINQQRYLVKPELVLVLKTGWTVSQKIKSHFFFWGVGRGT